MKTRKACLYNVTGEGKVISLTSNWRGYGERELKQTLHPDGYMRVRLHENGKRKSHKVHTLMAEKYLGPKPITANEVRHLDGNRLNNHYKNLAWGTQKENAQDRELHGRTSRGLKHSIAIKKGLVKSNG